MRLSKLSSFVFSSLLAVASGCASAPAPEPSVGEAEAGHEQTEKLVEKAEEKPSEPAATSNDASPDKPAAEPAPASTAEDKPISCEPKGGAPAGKQPKLELAIDRSKVDLENGKLEAKLTRPACKVVVKVLGESGAVLAEVTRGFDGAAAGTPLVVGWSSRGKEPIARIEVWGHDTQGSFVGVAITPWNMSVEHEEVNFENDSDAIRQSEVPKLEASLQKVKEKVGKYKGDGKVTLYISGFTDTVGSPDYNISLSRRRARSIASWFRGHGLQIPVAYEGFGENVPLVKTPDETPEPKNRRTDYTLSIEPPRLPSGSASFSWKGI
jgi:outer membrane protein OmpA-like peptidoglycan-associated protein